MSPKDLQKFKDDLLVEKKRIEEYLNEKAKPDPVIKGNYTTPQQAGDPNETLDEKAQEVTVFEEDRAIEQNMELRLKQINETLRQIEAGTYGTCVACKSKIDSKRLAASPSAQLCVACATKRATLA